MLEFDLHMLLRRYSPAELRTAAALLAAALGVFICIVQHHFPVDAHRPAATITLMTHHRCGLSLLGATLWLLGETLWLAVQTWRWRHWRRWRIA